MTAEEELDPEIMDIFESDRIFKDHEKIARLRAVIAAFFDKSKDRRDAKRLLSKLIEIVHEHPDLKSEFAEKDALKKPGLRLLQLSIPFSINSGVVTVTRNISKAFTQSGANVAIVNHWWHRYSYGKDPDKHYVKMSPYSLLRGDGNLLELRWAFKHILKDMKEKYKYHPQICHVHTHTFYEDKSIQLFHDYFPGVPIIFTLHAFIPYIKLNTDQRERLLGDRMPKEEIMQIRNRAYAGREKSQEGMIKIADRIITISQAHKDAFDRFYPELKDKCVCIPNGTDFELYSELKGVIEKSAALRSKIAPSGERIMIYVGRIEPQKGARALVNGFNHVAAKYPDVKLVLIGPDKSKESVLLELGLDKRFLSRISYEGWVKDRELLAAYYRLADVMVQPVFSKDLYGMAVLEAMIMKVPVISCPGVLTVGNCGSPEEIVRAVDHIFTNKEAVSRHVSNVRERVMADFSLSSIYKKHMELYSSLLR